MIVLAVDPGNKQTAWVLYDTSTGKPVEWAKEDNQAVLARLRPWRHGGMVRHLAIEMIARYGMGVGRDVFDTACWIGRFIEGWGGPYNKVLRKGPWGSGPEDYLKAQGQFPGVCMTLCRNNTANDSNILHAIYDRYGGSRRAAVGLKASPGPLYDMKADEWQAFAVALTWTEHMGTGAVQ